MNDINHEGTKQQHTTNDITNKLNKTNGDYRNKERTTQRKKEPNDDTT